MRSTNAVKRHVRYETVVEVKQEHLVSLLGLNLLDEVRRIKDNSEGTFSPLAKLRARSTDRTLLRLDQKLADGALMNLKRMANVLNTDAMLLQEFWDRFSKYGDKTLTLFADGQAVEIPVF